MIFAEWLGTESGCYQEPEWGRGEGSVTADSDFYGSNNKRRCSYDGAPDVVPETRLTDLGGFEICGKRGGKPFVEITRVDAQGNCPNDKVPCSAATSRENTVCVTQTEKSSG